MNNVSFICYACGSFVEASSCTLPKGWIIPKHGLIQDKDVNAVRPSAPPESIIALCSVGCFNKIASGQEDR